MNFRKSAFKSVTCSVKSVSCNKGIDHFILYEEDDLCCCIADAPCRDHKGIELLHTERCRS